MIKDKHIKAILEELAQRYNLTVKEVEEIVESPYKFMRETISNIDFKNMTEEEFNNTKKSFNIPSMFKFYPSKNAFKKINKLK